MINEADGLEVVDTARNGEVAIKKIKQFNPDVVTLDVEMPVMDGLTALKQIMRDIPVPVIMLSSLTVEGANSTIQSIEFGAVDFLSKPSGPISLDIENVQQELVQKIKAASQANIYKYQLDEKVELKQTTPNFKYQQFIVSIGVSTGGPKALQTLLQDIPKNFPAPILIVQHMPPRFTKSLADRLNRISNITVKEATSGELLKEGFAYVAPGGYHLRVENKNSSLVTVLDQTKTISSHCPSVNELFQSLANISGFNHIGLVLTGMGNDGTIGAKELKEKTDSNYLMAESEKTAVIYGMPRSIVEKVGADSILPIDQMAIALTRLVK